MLVRADAFSEPTDVTPPGFNVRTTVHEYGGGAYLLHDGTVYFSNFSDQRHVPAGCGRRPGPDHARHGRPRSVRGRTGHPRRAIARLRPRTSSRARRSVRGRERARHAPSGRLLGAAHDPLRPRLLLDAEDRARRLAAQLARVGPAVDAVGRVRARRRRPRGGREPLGRPAGRGPRGRGVDLPAHLEPGRRTALRLRPNRLVEPLPRARRRRPGAPPGRRRVRVATVGLRDDRVRVPERRADRLPVGAGRAATPGDPRSAVRRAHRPRCPLLRDGASARCGGRPGGVRRGRTGDPRRGRRPRRHRSVDRRAPVVVLGRRRGRDLDPTADRVPHGGRADSLRALLSTARSRRGRTRGRTAARDRDEPWRTDRRSHAALLPGDPVLDEPWVRRGRRRTTAGAPDSDGRTDSGSRARGGSSTRRTASTRLRGWPPKGRSTGTAS